MSVHHDGRTALGDEALEILLGSFDQRKQGTARTTGRLSEDGHIVGIAAEALDVLVYPFQGHQLIQGS